MRKIFSFLAAAAMLFTASCSNDDLGTDNGNEAQVTFNLGLEGQAGTRAIGDGTTVNKLSYAVFDAQNNLLTELKGDKTNAFASGSETVSLKLAKNQNYTVVFWAQNAEAPYTLSEDRKTVTINYKANNENVAGNDEKRDAFFFAHQITNLAGSDQINVVLERPFAQLNVGVTKEDYNAAVASGVTIKNSWAKVEKVNNTLNLLSGEATGEVNAEFALAERPTQDLGVDLNGDGKVKSEDNETFAYLSMNYILVGNRKNVKASFRFENEDGSKKIEFNSGLDAVPVERNFRTNLVGQILTGNLDFNVTIDADFKGDVNYSGIVYANNQEEVNSALKDANAHTIILGAGEFTFDLYANAHSKNTLNIVGTTGTKVKFANLQVRAELFKNFRIVNCEILRMPNKSWGMMVFGSGMKSDGVYTISNCTFNGVGTQGIYINETVSGATYNIEDCTFNGDFGSEGAITIQTNNAQFNVNVRGCTFNNIPTTSHRICLVNGTNPIYYGWNLNTDLKATTAYEIDMFVKLGKETIELADGNYEMPQNNLQGKTLTFKGSKNAVIDCRNINANNQFVTGANLKFEGVTLNFGAANYMGFANCASLTYKNCDINGLQFLYNEAKFEGCNLNSNGAEHCVWTYGSKKVSFESCEFTYTDRCVNIYVDNGTGSVDVAFDGCKFATNNASSVGAVEINSSAFPQGANVEFKNNCTSPNNGHMVFISKWDSTAGNTATVKVNGSVITTPVQQ